MQLYHACRLFASPIELLYMTSIKYSDVNAIVRVLFCLIKWWWWAALWEKGSPQGGGRRGSYKQTYRQWLSQWMVFGNMDCNCEGQMVLLNLWLIIKLYFVLSSSFAAVVTAAICYHYCSNSCLQLLYTLPLAYPNHDVPLLTSPVYLQPQYGVWKLLAIPD